MTKFTVLSQKDVLDLIKGSPIRSSTIDPIPVDLFILSIPTLLPVLTQIINLSLQTGIFPTKLKHAQLSPILKKFNLDPDTLNNYRPISNLPYISKLVERVVAKQLTTYLAANSLFEPLQSAYQSNHSTETALLHVLNDLLVALDSCSEVFVRLLDCSAAFDLVDHSILLHSLNSGLGLSAALDWLCSPISLIGPSVLPYRDKSQHSTHLPVASLRALSWAPSSSRYTPCPLVISSTPTTLGIISMQMIPSYTSPMTIPCVPTPNSRP